MSTSEGHTDAAIRVVSSKGMEEWPAARLEQLLKEFDRVLVDVGTGDAKFPLRWARANPDTFCVGIDPNPEPMSRTAVKAAKKPSRGGVSNLVLVRASLDEAPACLDGLADLVTVLYPWAGLLHSLVTRDSTALARLAALARPGGSVRLLINAHVLEWERYAERLGLPAIDPDALSDSLADAFAGTGLVLARKVRVPPGEPPLPSTWGRRLSRASRRPTLDVEFSKRIS